MINAAETMATRSRAWRDDQSFCSIINIPVLGRRSDAAAVAPQRHFRA